MIELERSGGRAYSAPSLRLSARSFSKTFAGVRVLDAVDMDVHAGEIHGLIGENGSGKSTFIKILASYHHPDPDARLFMDGQEVSLPMRAGKAHELGLCFIHQDLGLVGTMSVLENLSLGSGYLTGKGGRIRWGLQRQETLRWLRRFDLDVNPEIEVRQLGQAEHAIVAIIRALAQMKSRNAAGVIVLDEPTSQLPTRDVDRLFDALRRVTDIGASAIFVSHRIDEVLAITDRVSVLRDGKLVGTVVTAETNQRELLSMMLGRDLGELYPDEMETSRGITLLSIKDLSGRMVHNLSFDLHAGEVLGITGLVGMGQDELPYLLFGVERARSGTLNMNSEQLEVKHQSPRRALRQGIVLLPADRQRYGGMQSGTVRENIMLPVSGQFFERLRLRHRLERAHVRQLLENFRVRPSEPEWVLKSLSGGNQQKALLGKWLQMKPPVVLLHEPTHGVDIGARKQIFEVMSAITSAGSGILVCSAEHQELVRICDRVLVLRKGQIVAELSGNDLNEDKVAEHVHAAPR